MFKKRGKYIVYILLASFFVAGIFHVVMLWKGIDMFEVDMAGHIASVASLLKGNYHYVVDTWFGGYISHLFYPPLEAGITGIINLISGLNLVASYKVYLSILLLGYLASIVLFTRNFKKPISKIVFLAAFLLLIFWGSEGLQYFQGLTFYDFFVTGLTSEFLGAIFLWAVVYILYKHQSTTLGYKQLLLIAIFGALAIASHIVIGAVALCILIIEVIRKKEYKLIIAIGLGLLMSSFVRLPTLAAKSQMVAGTLIEKYIDVCIVLVAILALSIKRKSLSWTLIIAIVCMTILPSLGFWLEKSTGLNMLPSFHYTRFFVIAWSLLIIILADLFETKAITKQQKHLKYIITTLVFLFMIKNHSGWLITQHKSPDMDPVDVYSYQDTIVQETENLLKNTNKRVLSVDLRSPIAFSFDALFGILGSDVEFAKGLFRESTINNSMLSTYLVNFFDGNSTAIVNSLYFNYTDCNRMKSYFDNFVQDYNLGAIIAPDIHMPTYMSVDTKTCYIDILQHGTSRLDINKVYTFDFRGYTHFLYSITPKEEFKHEFTDITTINSLETIKTVSRENNDYLYTFANALDQNTRMGKIDNNLYVFENSKRNDFAQQTKLPTPTEENDVSLHKIKNGNYTINTLSDQNTLFLIKKNYFPGWKLYNAAGESFPLFESPQGMLAYGHGEMTLIYEKEPICRRSYVISLLALATSLGMYLGFRRKKN